MSLSDQERMEKVRENLFRARIETIILSKIQERLDDLALAAELASSIMDSVYSAISARWYNKGISDQEEANRYGG